MKRPLLRIFSTPNTGHPSRSRAAPSSISRISASCLYGARRFSSRRDRPVVLLYNGKGDPRPRLPADLGGLIYLNYAETGDRGLVDFLADGMRRMVDTSAGAYRSTMLQAEDLDRHFECDWQKWRVGDASNG
ncbi:MAG: hypothetical protein GY835_18620 [bacterium]|nr:hypothetical protein [bacterium]